MERLKNMHPYSKYGNAMCGSVWDSLMADQIMEEEEIRLQTEKNQILSGLAEQEKEHGYFVLAVLILRIGELILKKKHERLTQWLGLLTYRSMIYGYYSDE
jgi:hypothetical protein